MSKSIIIIGGGAAGLMAAICAARAGAEVILLERLHEPGKKILTTGGGRCNISTAYLPSEYIAHFSDKTARFLRPAIYAMDVAAITDFFASIGVPIDSPVSDKLFPVSQKAKDVRDRLVAECRRVGVNIWCNIQCNTLLVEKGVARGVACTDGSGEHELSADAIILCAGGKSMDSLGSDGSGFDLARACGHTIIQPVPALVPLITEKDWPGELAGLSVPDCSVSVEVQNKITTRYYGDILFTHKGVSGPAVLNCSGEVCAALAESKKVALLIDFVSFSGKEQNLHAGDLIKHWRQHGTSRVLGLLSKRLPERLAKALCYQCGISPSVTAATLEKNPAQKLEKMLAGCRLEIHKSEGFGKSYVTRGGVSLKDVNGKTMESRRVKGLYFAGEVLDVDATTGGFNLQWAWASGNMAGMSALQSNQ